MHRPPDPPRFGHLLSVHIISHSSPVSHSAPATPGFCYSLFMSSFQLTQALHLLFLLPGRSFPQIPSGLTHLLVSHVHSHATLLVQPSLTTLYKMTPLPLMLFSNLLTLLHFSLVLSTAWHNSICVFIVCISPENIRFLKDRLLSVLLTIRSYKPTISLPTSRCSINTSWMGQ